ncbi:MAG: hypothetical protein FKY71_06045 [Spiribacter salinus]|uniref:Uncharacterized protein n=1 Tax=Spiribacter salinus TaxID=1335746 RepID=A0A540VT83_9GAMM|nr:MAG: hypothetical protein FKY71_06045 [Spiribacter salinus]
MTIQGFKVSLAFLVILLLTAVSRVGAIGPEDHSGPDSYPGDGDPVVQAMIFWRDGGSPHSARVILYAYAGGDPVNRWDPTGLDDIEVRDNGDVYWVPEWYDPFQKGGRFKPRHAKSWTGVRWRFQQDDDANAFKIGTIQDGSLYVDLDDGGRARLESLEDRASRVYTGGFGQGASRDFATNIINGFRAPFDIVAGSGHVGIFFGGTSQFAESNAFLDFGAYQGSRFYLPGVGNAAEYNFWGRLAGGAWGDNFEENIGQAFRDVQRAAAANGGNVQVDIFGFSRGAAQAAELARLIGGYNKSGISVNFVGAYDPVYSVGFMTPGQQSRYVQSGSVSGNFVYVDVPAGVGTLAASYAQHEQRVLFPMTVFRLRDDPNVTLRTRIFPGVHGNNGNYAGPSGVPGSGSPILGLQARSWMRQQAIAAGAPISSEGTLPGWINDPLIAGTSAAFDRLGVGYEQLGQGGALGWSGPNAQWIAYRFLPWRWFDPVSASNLRPRDLSAAGGN